MSTPEFMLWVLWGLMSPWQALPFVIFVVWLVFAVRIWRRHEVILEDFYPEGGESE